ncbi:MAG: pyridine nucleotide-disulfide oxidoreductase [Epsilonproteobacteria bacterium]|nr:MAG: pyridine nucleotide-disulfide oxidoreductase [Campylobacterota bacterium]
MLKNVDVLIIGGGAAGIVSALFGKSLYKEKSFMVIKKNKTTLIPCAIPYTFSYLGGTDKDAISNEVLTKNGIELLIDEVTEIDIDKKVCKTKNDEISYDKLIIATGSIPKVPRWLKGADLENVFTITKDKDYLDNLISRLDQFKRITIIGGGFIGVEVAGELINKDKQVTIVEILPYVLSAAFDQEIAMKAQEILSSKGVNVITNKGVRELAGDKEVKKVILQDGTELETDAVILSMGYVPNTELAKRSNIKLNSMGFIEVDNFMRTSALDVFAVGDCAEKKDFLTNKPIPVMLASVACTESRIAAMNLYSSRITNKGTIGIFSTVIDGVVFSSAGITESKAKELGINVITSTFETMDKHPGILPQANKQLVKLIVIRDSGQVIGGEVIGSEYASELINVIGRLIENKTTLYDIIKMQVATHPLITAAPTSYPIIKAAEILISKLKQTN